VTQPWRDASASADIASSKGAALLENRHAFEASLLARALPFSLVALGLGLATTGVLLPMLIEYVPGSSGWSISLERGLFTVAFLFGGYEVWRRLFRRALTYVVTLRVNEIGLHARRALTREPLFVAWDDIAWSRFTRLEVVVRYVEGRETRELRLLVPWRQTVEVVELKSYVVGKLRPSASVAATTA
jgi:hypothetical protein